ncbi:hypothetical protein [Niabella soli]|uniref:Uncharacterized protein n=1 Tax=Niabella soli DSM 19437 TaxID=929713 RepID=W0F7L6_9BACT|nr:hypothetical protein [Niabella soli]AHF17798.1 hypothetical protein NIASO_14450 [Niabella soli DSM 19437]
MSRVHYYFLLCCCLPSFIASAQNPTLNITSSTIAGEIATSDNSFTSNGCLLSIGAYIKARANTDFSPLPSPPILSKIKLLVTAIGPNVNLGGAATEQPLSLTDQPLYSAVVSLGGGGAVAIRYRIPQTEMTSYAWKAGTYTTGLTFTSPGGSLCLGTSTFPATLKVIVNPFIVLSTPPSDLTLTVNDLKYFRTTPLSGSHTLPFSYTVPLGLHVKTAAVNFAYTNGYSGASDPNTATGNVSANISAPVTGAAIALSTSYQNLSPAGGYAVPTGNNQTNTVTYSITPATLKAAFIQKGSYTTTLNYEAFDAGTTPLAGSVQQNAALVINVSDLGALQASSDLTLSFNNVTDYTNGVSASLVNALTISKTTPYDVYVKASSDLVNGSNSIPVSCISLASDTGDPTVTAVTLSTASQKIISAAAPVIDRQVALKYSITSDKTAQILGKPAGTYTAGITYSFVAL